MTRQTEIIKRRAVREALNTLLSLRQNLVDDLDYPLFSDKITLALLDVSRDLSSEFPSNFDEG